MKHTLSALLALTSALPVTGAVPGEKAGVVNDTSRVVDLDEVVVVAQPKEAFRLRQQPLSSHMSDAATMQRLGATDLRQLSAYIPSFVMPDYGSRYTSSIYVRGIGSRVDNPAVGVYIDNIPLMNKSMFNSYIYQTERIDVLRGPQGTLYGQNTEGGLVRLFTYSPLTHQGTDVLLGIGAGLSRKAEVSHSLLLNDRMGLSLSAFYHGQDGFFHNATTDTHADESNEAGGRVRLDWRFADRFTATLLADYQHARQHAFPYGVLDMPTGDVASPLSNRQSTYRRDMLTTGLTLNYQAKAFELNSTTSWQYLKDDMLMDIDYTALDVMHMEQAQQQNALTEELTVKSRTASRWHWAFGAFASQQWMKTDAPVHFDSAFDQQTQARLNSAIPQAMADAMIKGGMPAAVAGARVAAMQFSMHDLDMQAVPGMFRTPQANLGLFHESNIDITPRLTATLGLRYDYSRVSIDYATSAAMGASVSMMVTDRRPGAAPGAMMPTEIAYLITSSFADKLHNTHQQLLPKAALTWRVGQQGSNIYAVVSKGYRAGGYNIQMFSDIFSTQIRQASRSYSGGQPLGIVPDAAALEGIAHTISYKPEESWNYELGTHLNLLDRRLQLDLSGYYMQIRNQQLSVMAADYGYGRMMVNAGKSSSCGIEAALRGSFFDNRLIWALGYGFTRAVFKEYNDSVADAATGSNVLVSYKNNHVPFVPDHTFSAHADYRIGVADDALLHSVVVGLNVAGRGRTYWDEANSYSESLYATLGAHVDLDMSPVTVSFWGRNLTDTRYSTFAFDNRATGRLQYFAQQANPLQVGLDVRFSFSK